MKVDGSEIKTGRYFEHKLVGRERKKIGRSFRFGSILIDDVTPGVSQREMQ